MAPRGWTTKGRVRLFLAVVLVAVILVFGAVYASEVLPSSHVGSTYTSTSYSASPGDVLSTAVSQNQAGYVLESTKPGAVNGGLRGGDWALLGDSDGSSANMSVLAFSSVNGSQAYYRNYVDAVKGEFTELGFTNSSADLSAYQQYGRCFAYGDDVDSIAVLDGICADGNLVLQIHLVSGVSYQQLEGDMTSLMGSMYAAAESS
jgi:hypothetical protein